VSGDKKNWVDRRLDLVDQIERDSPGLWNDLLLSIEDALQSYVKRCPHNPLRLVSHERVNGTSFRVSFEKGNQAHTIQRPVLVVRLSRRVVEFTWSDQGFGKDGYFLIEARSGEDTVLSHEKGTCSPDQASEIILSAALFEEGSAIVGTEAVF